VIENLTPITAVYGGRLRVGRVASQHVNLGLFFAHFDGDPRIPNDGGTWVDMCVADEDLKWIRGIHVPDSVEAQALLAVEALR
jgi:hypothetical protein